MGTKKLFEGVNLAANTVVSGVTDVCKWCTNSLLQM